MIVSHKHKFIYVRTRKTASSSLMHSLLEHAGPDDIFFGGGDEEWGAKNWEWGRDFAHWPIRAALQRGIFTPEEADKYIIFTVERNPWAKARSLWSFHKEDHGLSWEDWLRLSSGERDKRFVGSDWGLYTINGKLCADIILDFDQKENISKFISRLLKTPFEFGHHHKNLKRDSDYTKHYTPELKALVAEAYRNELETFGYRFGEKL